jgi:hypothetical protein
MPSTAEVGAVGEALEVAALGHRYKACAAPEDVSSTLSGGVTALPGSAVMEDVTDVAQRVLVLRTPARSWC